MEELHSSPATPDQWAVRWIKALPGADHRVRAAFASWVRHSTTYTETYLRQKMLSTELQGLDPDRRIDVQDLIARARARIHCDGKVVSWPHQPRKRLSSSDVRTLPPTQFRPSKRAVVAMIFSMGALMVCPQVQLHRSIEHALYTTAFGQQQRVELPDGSNVTLSPQSQLRVEYSPLRREIELLRGEVLFAVQHDARKPFRVRVGTTVVEDVGTTFDVRIGSVGTTVVVSEGRVMLRSRPAQGNPPVLMAQNDEAFVSEAGAPVVTHISPQRIASLTAWTRQLVLMDDMTLAEAVSELNRYNRIQLRLRDPDVGKLRLGGTFNLRRPLVFAASLSALGCQITPDGRDVVWISGCRSGT